MILPLSSMDAPCDTPSRTGSYSYPETIGGFPLTSDRSNPRRAGLSLLGLLASSQLAGCLMVGNSPSGSDMRWLYAVIVAMVMVVILWLVLRYMK